MKHASSPAIASMADLPVTTFDPAERTWWVSGLDAQDHIFHWMGAEPRLDKDQPFKHGLASGAQLVETGSTIDSCAVPGDRRLAERLKQSSGDPRVSATQADASRAGHEHLPGAPPSHCPATQPVARVTRFGTEFAG